MEIDVNEIDKHRVELLITVPWNDVSDNYSELLKRYSKNYVKGFRPEAAPLSMIEKVFQKEIRADFTYQFGQQICRKAMQSKDLQAGSHIEICDAVIIPGKKFSFNANFLRMPHFELPDYRNLELNTHDEEDRLTEISEVLLNSTPFEVPIEFIDHELRFSDIESGASEATRRNNAEKRVRLMLILKRIGSVDGIEVDEEDVKSRINDLAVEYEVTERELKKHLVETGAIYRLKDYILAEYVLKYLSEIHN